MLLKEKYTCSIERKKGRKLNPHLIVSIYQANEKGEKTKIGQYDRDHHDLFNTFFPFKQDGKEFALISKHYSKIYVIELPSCRIIAEESWNSSVKESFYPIDFFVSDNNSKIGFVAGIRANDETSCKIEYLDLSDIINGKIFRDNRFGHIELPEGIKLENAVQYSLYKNKYSSIDIAINLSFTNDGELLSKESIAELLKKNGYIVFNKKRVIKEE